MINSHSPVVHPAVDLLYRVTEIRACVRCGRVQDEEAVAVDVVFVCR